MVRVLKRKKVVRNLPATVARSLLKSIAHEKSFVNIRGFHWLIFIEFRLVALVIVEQ